MFKTQYMPWQVKTGIRYIVYIWEGCFLGNLLVYEDYAEIGHSYDMTIFEAWIQYIVLIETFVDETLFFHVIELNQF